MLIRWSRLKFAQLARRGWFAPDIFPIGYFAGSAKLLCRHWPQLWLVLWLKARGIEEQMQVLSCCDAGEPSMMDTHVDEVSLDKERVFCSFLFHIKANNITWRIVDHMYLPVSPESPWLLACYFA